MKEREIDLKMCMLEYYAIIYLISCSDVLFVSILYIYIHLSFWVCCHDSCLQRYSSHFLGT